MFLQQMSAIRQRVLSGVFCGLLALVGTLSPPAFGASRASGSATLPAFLPSYYIDVLNVFRQPFRLAVQSNKEGVDQATLVTPDESIRVLVERITCDRATCDALYDQRFKEQNAKLTKLKGEFKSVTPVQFAATWKERKRQMLRFVAKTPKALVTWVQETGTGRREADEAYFSTLEKALNRQRYEEAIRQDNVEIGRWAREIYRYAKDLQSQGQYDDALAVLKPVVTWSAASYDAQMDFAELTLDADAAQASAQAVWDNAESSDLVSRAAHLLGHVDEGPAAVPVLEPGLKGLQVILIPLPPCDTRLLDEASRQFSASLNIPVHIARLKDGWSWDAPDRVYRQRDIQGMIVRKVGKPLDFSGWSPERYAKELLAAVSEEDSFTRYSVRTFINDSVGKPGQYRAETYVDRLNDRLAPLRGGDRRTMYVGVTAADIYGGDANFLFSGAAPKNGAWAGILSYARMQAETLGEPYQSRKRLVERLAKELVPASLKQLGIPRPSDPTDPYSYSDGVQRLDQKTLTLSASTRQALDQLRRP